MMMMMMCSEICIWIYLAYPCEDYTRVYISHSRESSQAVCSHPFAHTICTVVGVASRIISRYSISYTIYIRTVAHCSHGRTLFAHYSHGRTLFAHYSPSRTLFAHYSRGSHTIRAIVTPNSHTIRTSSHPGHTIRTVGASPFAVFALIHAVFAQFTPVRI